MNTTTIDSRRRMTLAKIAIRQIRAGLWKCLSECSNTLETFPSESERKSGGCIVHLFQHLQDGNATLVSTAMFAAYERTSWIEPVVQWADSFPDDRDRLIAILQNIVRNNGTFVPTDIRPIEVDTPSIPSLDFHNHDVPANQIGALSAVETLGLVTD